MDHIDALRQAEEVIQYLGQQQSQLSLQVIGKTLRQLRDVCERVAVKHEKRISELERSLEQARDAYRELKAKIDSDG